MCSKPGIFNPCSMGLLDRISGRKVNSLKAPYMLAASTKTALLPVLHIEVLIKLFFEQRILSYCQISLKTIGFNEILGKRFVRGR